MEKKDLFKKLVSRELVITTQEKQGGNMFCGTVKGTYGALSLNLDIGKESIEYKKSKGRFIKRSLIIEIPFVGERKGISKIVDFNTKKILIENPKAREYYSSAPENGLSMQKQLELLNELIFYEENF